MNPITTLVAEEGVRALAAGLPDVVDERQDVATRTEALYGAYLNESAFPVASAGLHHMVCRLLGGSHDLSHAETQAVVLPHVLAPYARPS